MDKTGGQAIEKALNGICGERPLTHELICSILDGLDCKVRDVLIYKEQEGTFFAKLTLLMRNELGEKIVELANVVLPAGVEGPLALYYNAWPAPVTAQTPDEEDLPLDPEVAVLLPLYIASQLYKDDDITLATVYRNEFEVAFSLLQRADSGEVGGEFTSATGWW